ncbi:hypothetical protein CFC21_093225 [Triticum aestivum]|uniref:Bifunctional inhibitor/plant lipid transfer protein/seed storage helical domain-containing protein n=5 Tax=Triticinae TaxID=1648030 RepID=A0A9R1LKG9_WHEAT|nr:hypothetical protein CFC21_093225 [Triticum aestivum]
MCRRKTEFGGAFQIQLQEPPNKRQQERNEHYLRALHSYLLPLSIHTCSCLAADHGHYPCPLGQEIESTTNKLSMASNHRRFLLSGAVLLSVLAAVAALESVEDECQPGVAFPHNALATCHTYVIKRVCGRGPSRPMLVKERCCRELAVVPDYCRCEALRVLMDGVRAEEGHVVEGRLGDRRDCPREAQREFAATLVTAAECNLPTVSGVGSTLGATGRWMTIELPK